MKWKQFWKTTNRGAWLSLLVVIGLVIYVVVGNIQFRNKHGKEIENVFSAYLEEIKAFNLATPEQAANGYQLTTSEADAKKAQLQEIGKKYWTNVYADEPNMEYYNTYRIFQNYIGNWYSDATIGKTTVLLAEYTYILENVKIKQNGPGAAYVTATLLRNVAGPADGIYMGVVTTGYLDGTVGEDGLVRDSQEYSLELEFAYVDGEWKISYLECYENFGW